MAFDKENDAGDLEDEDGPAGWDAFDPPDDASPRVVYPPPSDAERRAELLTLDQAAQRHGVQVSVERDATGGDPFARCPQGQGEEASPQGEARREEGSEKEREETFQETGEGKSGVRP